MLGLLKSKRYSYSGHESYRYVEKIIKNGRNICISSPYIDRYYAAFLLRNCAGKQIRIIASSIDSDAARMLRGGGVRLWPFKLSAFVIIMDAFLYLLHAAGLALIAASVALIACSLFFVRMKSRGISLKVPREFVHAKMYIAETEAASGSANFTYRGMHKNVEHIDVVTDPKDVKELRRQFQSIWDAS